MKIRTDFVTNSSSSSFTVAIKFKMKDGKEITHSANWIDEETDLVVSKDPFELAKAKDIDELIDLLNESIFIGVVGYDHESDEVMYDDEGNEIYVKADEEEYEDYLADFNQFGDSLKDKLKNYSMEDIQTITLKTFETDDMSSSYNYDELPPEDYEDEVNQTHYEIYRYDLVNDKAAYFDDGGFVETNGGIGGTTVFKISGKYKEKDDYKSFDKTKATQKIKKSDFLISNGILKKYKGKEEDVVIPDSVTEIYDSAFMGNQNIKTVIIPDSVQKIGSHAFFDCKSLKSVTIPRTVNKIYSGAFKECNSLANEGGFVITRDILWDYFGNDKNIIIPDGVKRIASSAFSNCQVIESVQIPESITEIGNSAFEECNNLKKVTIEGKIEDINEKTFFKCALLKEVYLPDSVRKIGDAAFRGCTSLEDIIIPKSLEEIGKYAFADCKVLKTISVPTNVKIGDSAFSGCCSLMDENGYLVINNILYSYSGKDKKIIIPEGVEKIAENAFFGQKQIKTVIIPDTVKEICCGSFVFCKSLKSVTIPESVLSIDVDAFAYCDNLQEIHYPSHLKEQVDFMNILNRIPY